ncbi:hypothetical protein [Rugamonas sp.]|uniref:hypothetical protein n=1 Tax=Rugamonas sp. TaxID=1926287 RepID=UPI0025F9BE80|nr:hypothetical protein [Rugamonas sp.]
MSPPNIKLDTDGYAIRMLKLSLRRYFAPLTGAVAAVRREMTRGEQPKKARERS